MRGAFGIMAAAAATVVVAAWRRVQREGVGARIARRVRERELAAEPAPPPLPRSAPLEPVGVPSPAARFEPVEIRVVSRTTRPEPLHVESLRATTPEPRDRLRAAPPKPPKPIDAGPASAEPPRARRSQSEDAAPPVPAPPAAVPKGDARPDRSARPPAWPGGSRPGPARVPRPTYWPAVLALGATWAAWGAISTPLLIFGGLAVFALAIAFWIREMIHAD